MTDALEFGLDTFGDVTLDADGQPRPQAQVLRDVVEEAVLADQLGLAFIGLGEHHRKDFSISAPDVLGGAIAGRTRQIHIGSSVTVLSTDDPVRVYERFSTLNAISSGRAEIIAGRGSFTESYPLFGFDLQQYELLFEERLDLLAALIRDTPVTWEGQTRSALQNQIVYPPVDPGKTLKLWVGVGGTPKSVARAAHYGLPLMLAIIGGSARRFTPYVELFYRALQEFGKERLPVGVHSPGHVAATDEEAREQLWPNYQILMARIGAERGWPPVTRAQFDREASPEGSLYVGSPETVARRIAASVKALDVGRFDLIYTVGPQPISARTRAVELYGSKVIPMVRDILAG